MPRPRGRPIRRLLALGVAGGLLAYRKQRLDAADRELPEAHPRTRRG